MGVDAFTLQYQKSPIVFVGGIASSMPGGILPVTSITQSQNYADGVTGEASPLGPNDYLFDFFPAPGGTLARYDIGRYPFANQTIAANAIIAQPLDLSMLMLAPVNKAGGYAQKLSVFQALTAAIQKHARMGGTYSVATPAFLYQNMILLDFQDVSGGEPQKSQERWRWDFIQPLLTIEAARAAQNSLMQKISAGTPLTADQKGMINWSGQAPAVGNPASGQGGGTVPAAQNLPGGTGGAPSPTYGPTP